MHLTNKKKHSESNILNVLNKQLIFDRCSSTSLKIDFNNRMTYNVNQTSANTSNRFVISLKFGALSIFFYSLPSSGGQAPCVGTAGTVGAFKSTHIIQNLPECYSIFALIFALRSNTLTSNHNFFICLLFCLYYRDLLFASTTNLEAGPRFAGI